MPSIIITIGGLLIISALCIYSAHVASVIAQSQTQEDIVTIEAISNRIQVDFIAFVEAIKEMFKPKLVEE